MEQEQRRRERELRKHKRLRDTANALGDREEELRQKRIIRAKGKKLRGFIDEHGLTRNKLRERNMTKVKPHTRISGAELNKDAISKAKEKVKSGRWTETFGNKVSEVSVMLGDEGHKLTHHAATRLAERIHRQGVGLDQVADDLRKSPKYSQTDGRNVIPGSDGLYYIQNPDTKEIVSCVLRPDLRDDWKELD